MAGPKSQLPITPEILSKLDPIIQDKLKKGESLGVVGDGIIEKLKRGESLDPQEIQAVGYTGNNVPVATTSIPQAPPSTDSKESVALKLKIENLKSEIAAKKEEKAKLEKEYGNTEIGSSDSGYLKQRINDLERDINKKIVESNTLQNQYNLTYGSPPPVVSQPSNPPTNIPDGNKPAANSPAATDNGSAAKYLEEQKKEQEEREKKLKEQLGGDDAAGKLRLGYQAALMMMADKILQKTGRNTFSQYSNFAITRFADTGHVNLSNNLFKTPDMGVFFKKIPTSVLSFLVPSVKLYKVFYPSLENSDGPSSSNVSLKGYSWRIPFDDIPVNYKNSTSTLQPQIDKILKGYDKLKGCGIKSFTYSYKGVTPAESNSHIEAQLELFFQDINILLTKIDIYDQDLRFEEKDKPSLANKTFYYSDLINGASRFTKSNGRLLANDQYFRLKVIAGYADTPDETFRNLLSNNTSYSIKEIESFRNAIKSTNITFFLSPITHDLQFNEDGSVILKINYQASIDSTLSDPLADIFKISDQDGSLLAAKSEYQAIVEQRDQELSKIKCGNSTQIQQQRKSITDEAGARLKEQEAKLNGIKSQVQSEVFKRLIGLNQVGGRKINVYVADILNTAVGVDTEGKPIAGASEIRIRNAQNLRSENAIGNIETISVEESDFESTNPNPPPKEGDSSTADDAKKEAEKGSTASNDDVYIKVKFIFFGDLLDIAFEALKNLQPKKEMPKIIIGEIPISIPVDVSSDTIENIAQQEVAMEDFVYNFADIPISLELFNDYYYQNVIKKRLSEYPIHLFLNDVMEKLIKPAISPSVFGKRAVINNSIRISNFGFLLPLENPDVEPILGRQVSENFTGFINSDLSDKFKKRFAYAEPVHGTAQYLYIYDSMSAPKVIKKNNGDINADENSGIFHFYIGSETGIIKNMSFSKMDVPYAAESRAFQEGGKVSNRLRQVYSSTIKLIGNNIYRPGDYIYIDPIIFYKANNGADASADLQDKIGLGGYYMVTKVQTNVSGDNFETTLNCTHQAWKVAGQMLTAKDNKSGC